MRINMKVIVLFLGVLSAKETCANGAEPPSGGGSSYVHRTDWKNVYEEEGFEDAAQCVVDVKKTIKLKKNQVLDGKGCVYRWRGAGYPKKCHSGEELSESEERMFEMAPGSVIKNMHIECALDGILMSDNTRVENTVHRDCEEDCVTTSGKKNVIVNNEFYLCQDKCIQMNKASEVRIERNLFKHALRSMSGSGKKSGGARPIYASENRCENCEIMIRAQRNHEVFAVGNTLNRGECLMETVEEAVIYDEGGNVATNALLLCEDGTRNIKKR
jgi:hypothetical protein